MVQEYYFALATYMIEHPGASVFDIATGVGRKPSWVSVIKNSDMFQEYYKARYDEIVCGIKRKTETLVELAIDRMIDKVETMGDVLKVKELNDIVDQGSKRLGYGAAAPGVNVTIQTVAVGRDDLAAARKRIQETFGVRVESPLAAAPQVVPSSSKILANVTEAEVAEAP